MKDKELNTFLASVRRTRFVDYLDPLGETAQNAFERRLSWARVSQHDPAYADEARFLLDHAEELREVLRRELEEDDWVEEADVGREWDTRSQPRASRLRENDRITEIFQADDMEVSSAPQKHQSRPARAGAGPSPGAGAAPANKNARRDPPPLKAARAAVAEETDETRLDRTQQARAKPSTARSSDALRARTESLRDSEPPVKKAPPAQRAPVSRPPVDPRAVTVRKDSPSASRTPSSRPPSSTSPPSGPRQASPVQGAPTQSSTGQGAPSRAAGSRSPPSMPPTSTAGAAAAARSAARAAESAPTQRKAAPRPGAPGRARGRGEVAERSEFAPRLAESRPLRAMAEDEETKQPVASEVELEDWDVPEEPSTGIMRIEDVTAPPMKAVNPHDDTVALPSDQVPVDAGATRPSLPTRMRRPSLAPSLSPGGTSPLGGETRIRRPPVSASSTGSRASVEDSPRQRSWVGRIVVLLLLLLVMGGIGAAGVALVGGGAFAFDSERMGDLWAQYFAPDTSIVVPQPAPPPKPVEEASVQPVAPSPPAPDGPTPAPAAPSPSPAQPSVKPVQPANPTPAPPPQPSKAGKTAKSTTTGRPEGTPEAPVPSGSSAPPIDVRGLWVGSTTTGMSFKLTVLGQDPAEGGFEGTVEIQLDDGTFDSLAVNGKVDGGGSMSFKGGNSSFNAVVNGRRASGSYTLQSGSKASWTAVH